MLNKGVPRRKIKTLFKFLRLQRLQILEEKSNQKKKKKKGTGYVIFTNRIKLKRRTSGFRFRDAICPGARLTLALRFLVKLLEVAARRKFCNINRKTPVLGSGGCKPSGLKRL